MRAWCRAIKSDSMKILYHFNVTPSGISESFNYTPNNYYLIFLNDRIVAVKNMKSFWNPKNFSNPNYKQIFILGILPIEIVSKVFKRNIKKSDKNYKSFRNQIFSIKDVNQLLKLDKNNFQIFYSEIETIELRKSKIKSRLGTIKIICKRNVKFIIPKSENFVKIKENVARIFKTKFNYKESIIG